MIGTVNLVRCNYNLPIVVLWKWTTGCLVYYYINKRLLNKTFILNADRFIRDNDEAKLYRKYPQRKPFSLLHIPNFEPLISKPDCELSNCFGISIIRIIVDIVVNVKPTLVGVYF